MAGFKVQSIPYIGKNGVQRVDTFNIFNVKDYGKNFATGHLTISREVTDYDKRLIDAGCRVNNNGRIEGNVYCAFLGNAYNKAINARNGAIIENVKFELDPYPFIKKDGTFAYRTYAEGGIQINVIDFEFKQFDNNENTNNQPNNINEQLAAQRAAEPQLVYGKDVEPSVNEEVQDSPFGY